MSTDRYLVPYGANMAALGGLVWLVLVAGTLWHGIRLSIFDLLFLLAPWVVVPLALSLIPASTASQITRATGDIIRCLLPPGAAATTISFFVGQGQAAGALTFLWFLVGVALAVDGLNRLIRLGLHSFEQFSFAIGEGYALVGAWWLLASRRGLEPVGFHEPIVLLTAVHFHYAGMMVAVLAGLTFSEIRERRSPIILGAALSCAVFGPGLLGLAFLAGPKMKLAAVGLMVIGECAIAIETLRIGFASGKKIAGHLLGVGSVSVIFAIALAGLWALGEYPLQTFVNLEQMARYHGVLNSVGFGICSLTGWTLLRKKPQLALAPSSETVRCGRAALNLAAPRPQRLARWMGWAPLFLFPILVITLGMKLPPWGFMWLLAAVLYLGCKWQTWWEVRSSGRATANGKRSVAYLLLWPGMEPQDFVVGARQNRCIRRSEWFAAVAKTLAGIALIFAGARTISSSHPLLGGWVGMIGLILFLHFGTFHLAALCWQRAGIPVTPLMQRPLASRSLSELWGRRWNLGFRKLSHTWVFQPLQKRFGLTTGTLGAFLASGLLHDLVISVPARAGYGLPTAYFLVQGLGVMAERSEAGRRVGLGRAARGWLWTALVAVGPLYLLFHPWFVMRVMVPFLHALGG